MERGHIRVRHARAAEVELVQGRACSARSSAGTSVTPVVAGPFDLVLQGDTVAQSLGFEAGQRDLTNRVLVREFKGVSVETSLKLELHHLDAANPGAIAAIEVIQE